MKINKIIFDEAEAIVLKRVDLSMYYRDRVDPSVNLESERKTCCQLHHESIPSFTFYFPVDGNAYATFMCWGCKRSGNVINLHAYLTQGDNYDYAQALIDLAKLYKIEIPNFTVLSSSVTVEKMLQKKVYSIPSKQKSTTEANENLLFNEVYYKKKITDEIKRLVKSDKDEDLKKAMKMENMYLIGVSIKEIDRKHLYEEILKL